MTCQVFLKNFFNFSNCVTLNSYPIVFKKFSMQSDLSSYLLILQTRNRDKAVALGFSKTDKQNLLQALGHIPKSEEFKDNGFLLEYLFAMISFGNQEKKEDLQNLKEILKTCQAYNGFDFQLNANIGFIWFQNIYTLADLEQKAQNLSNELASFIKTQNAFICVSENNYDYSNSPKKMYDEIYALDLKNKLEQQILTSTKSFSLKPRI